MKNVLITGARRGFGYGVAKELAKLGYNVYATVHKTESIASTLEKFENDNVNVKVFKLDITNEVDRTLASKLDIDILINNAGLMESGPMSLIPIEKVRDSFEVNVFGTLLLSQAFIPQMVKKKNGKIIILSSMGGITAIPYLGTYTATKHALESISSALKTELSGTGVEVCTINPAAFKTGFNDEGANKMFSWFIPYESYNNLNVLNEVNETLKHQYDENLMINKIVEVVCSDNPNYRTAYPNEIIPYLKECQNKLWESKIKDDIIPGFKAK